MENCDQKALHNETLLQSFAQPYTVKVTHYNKLQAAKHLNGISSNHRIVSRQISELPVILISSQLPLFQISEFLFLLIKIHWGNESLIERPSKILPIRFFLGSPSISFLISPGCKLSIQKQGSGLDPPFSRKAALTLHHLKSLIHMLEPTLGPFVVFTTLKHRQL